MRIAVVGGGVAGIAAAHALQRQHDVTLYEAESRLGGHACPVTVHDGTRTFEVDTAFVIFNDGSYPLFRKFLTELGVARHAREAEMSFLIDDRGRPFHCTLNRGAGALFSQRANLVSPGFYSIFFDLLRFRRRALADLRTGALGNRTLAQYLDGLRLGRRFVENFIYPISYAVWSVPLGEILDFPAEAFLKFLQNHQYLEGATPHRWRSLEGSSRVYLGAFERGFKGRILLGAPVTSVRALVGAAEVIGLGENRERFDRVILATHADVSLRLLAEPTANERRLLGAWRYQETLATLHSDSTVLGERPRSHWGSWNVVYDSRRFREPGAGRVTYWLNQVQGLAARRDFFLTLGGDEGISPRKVLNQKRFAHPVFDAPAVASQAGLPGLNGSGAVAFCGSYFGFGFHEDAVRSGLAAAESVSST